MNILFVGGLFNDEQLEMVSKNSKRMPNIAANVHQWNIVNGLDGNLTILNPLFVGNFPSEYKKIFIKKARWSHDGVSQDISPATVAVFGIKQLHRASVLKKEMKRWLKKQNKEDTVVLLYTLDTSYLKAFLSAKPKNFKGKSCVIVPDLPLFFIQSRGKSKLYRILKLFDWRSMLKKSRQIDSFILLTEQMKDLLNVGNRPYLVSEGISSSQPMDQIPSAAIFSKTITYTGTLDQEFGIVDLIRIFKKMGKEDWTLQIAGDGNAKDLVLSAVKDCKNIQYLGVLSNAQSVELQRQSRILINPRRSDEAFTKYSFPSKTMEYLKTGRPVLMHRLPGIPTEYNEYILFFDGLDDASVAQKINEVMCMSDAELDRIGEAGKNFVEQEKSVTAQGKKITDFLENLIHGIA